MAITLKSPAEIDRMRRAGRVVAEVLALVESELRPGVSTAHLDALAEAHIRRSGAVRAPADDCHRPARAIHSGKSGP